MIHQQKDSKQQKSQCQSNSYVNQNGQIQGFIDKLIKLHLNKYISTCMDTIIIMFLNLSICIHTLITYFLITNNDTHQTINKLMTLIFGNSNIAIFSIVQIVLYLLKILQFISIYVSIKVQDSILSGICKNIIGNFYIIVQLDLILSSMLMLVNFQIHIFSFILAAAMSIFNTIFLNNYFDRKDMLYLSSIKDSLFLNLIIIIAYLVNCIVIRFFSFRTFVFMDVGLSCLLLVWYSKRGFLLIPDTTFKLFLSFIVIFKTSNSLIFLDYYFGQQQILIVEYLVKLTIFFIVFYFMFSTFFSHQQKFESIRKHLNISNIKFYYIFLSSIVQQSLTSSSKIDLVLGCLKYHQDIDCSNISCRLNIKYNPFNHNQQVILQQQRTTQITLKYYLKCLYQRILNQNINKTEVILDYCEFILNQFNNSYEICKLIEVIHLNSFNILQIIRLYKLRHVLQQTNKAFNKNVYDGNLEIQNMIVAEQNFEGITKNIEISININLDLWTMIQQPAISISQIRQKINQNLQLIKHTNKKFQFLSKYLKIQKRWRYILMNYSFFVLNQKIAFKDSQQFKSINENTIFVGESLFLYKQDNRAKLLSEKLLFDKKSFFIRAYINNESLQILSVSSLFQKLVSYSYSQIIGNSIDIILPADIKQTHHKKVLNWLQHGYCTDQTKYNPIFTQYLDRDGQQIEVVKYYKVIINIQSEHMLQFVCMLKVNQEEQDDIQQKSIEFDSDSCIDSIFINQEFVNSRKKNSLKIENNLFIKEESLKANDKIVEIERAKKSIRFLSFSIASLILTLMMITNRDIGTLTNNITQFLNFLNLYRFPMALSKNYMKNFLNLGTQSSVISQIQLGTQNVQAFNSDPMTLKTIFDTTLNVPKNYTPFLNNSFNNGLAYSQIQIYYLIISCIQSLSKLPINRTGYDFTQLNMYLIPSYDHMINSTKLKFHQTFQKNLQSMYIDQVILAIIEIVIFSLIIIYVFTMISAFYRKSKDILLIIFDFSEINIKIISTYWKTLLQHFQKLTHQNKNYYIASKRSIRTNKSMNLDFFHIKENLQKERNISFNKKVKTISETKQAKNNFIKSVIIIGVSTFIIIAGVVSLEVINIIQIKQLQTFQNDGYYFLQYFPATSVLGHALMERYYNQIYPKQIQFYPKRYDQYVSDMHLISQLPYIGSPQDSSSSYYQKQKNYMFGNPCTFNPQVLIAAGSTQAKCLTIYNKTLASGITTLLRAAQPQLQSYLNGSINLTSSQLDTLTSALTLVAYYITDAITTWANQFTTSVSYYQSQGNMLCIFSISIIVLLHIIFCQMIIFYVLEKDYRFVREVYDKMIPQYVITIEKVIRQRFIMEGIIKQI